MAWFLNKCVEMFCLLLVIVFQSRWKLVIYLQRVFHKKLRGFHGEMHKISSSFQVGLLGRVLMIFFGGGLGRWGEQAWWEGGSGVQPQTEVNNWSGEIGDE